ncbi:site-specific integrase [Desulfatibacillum aliphaticivorans]|uniref:site-specific integrase n=1 Tax=Desulfatibacillum aliphaticivorans TaxID=218208 RepID=UPI0003F5A6C4|nr:site-specific integrase [Desulfatibacillum aliphaticivorans]
MIEIFRSAGRGGTTYKGTTHQQAVSFQSRHMVLLASIEKSLPRAADNSRFLSICTKKDPTRKPKIPDWRELEEIRTDMVAYALCRLTWAQVDLNRGTAKLDPGTTKNNEGRLVFLDEELQGMLKGLHKKRKSLLPWVFLNERGTGRVDQFSKSWANACTKAKLGHRLFHDLRRTAVRNMVRSGVPEAVVMKISGHKTRSVFDRYNIVSEEDLKAAAFKQEGHLQRVAGTV